MLKRFLQFPRFWLNALQHIWMDSSDLFFLKFCKRGISAIDGHRNLIESDKTAVVSDFGGIRNSASRSLKKCKRG
jgi:hypothetical protein